MTPLVWANFPLALLFLLAWAGHPLRMTLRHPGTVPDRAAAHAYPAAKVALATGGEPETDCRRSLEQHRTDRRRTTRRPGGRQDDPRASQPASQPGRLLRSTLTAPHDRPGRAGGAARQDPGEGVLPAGGPQVAVRGRD
jgi:hypothetical protein